MIVAKKFQGKLNSNLIKAYCVCWVTQKSNTGKEEEKLTSTNAVVIRFVKSRFQPGILIFIGVNFQFSFQQFLQQNNLRIVIASLSGVKEIQ